MKPRVILVTGTPCVGKTTFSKKLAISLNALYINLTDLAEKEQLTQGKDQERDTTIVNEKKMRLKLRQLIDSTDFSDVIIDGHYAAAVTPKKNIAKIFVLRRNPKELRQFMQKLGFSKRKQIENLAAEILDVCLIEALQNQQKDKVCELDATGKTVDTLLNYALTVFEGTNACCFGKVDWLGMLESEGKVEEYLQI